MRDAFYLLACTVMNRLLESDPKNLVNEGVSLQPAAGQKAKGGCC